MTVASEVNRSGPYIGNGVTTTFAYDFRVLDAAHLRVIREQDGTETTLTLGADYSVSGVGDAAGGSITTTAAPSAAQTITILRNVPFTQNTDLENQGAYYAETIEAALDLLAMRDQQLSERLDRAIEIPASSSGVDSEALILDIIRLGASADSIDTVANISANVTTVAGIASDVTEAVGAVPIVLANAQAAAASAVAAQAARDAAIGAASSSLAVATRTELKAVDTTKFNTVFLLEAGREGTFVWKAGNFSAQVSLDNLEGVYVKADAVAASTGAWVRAFLPYRVPNVRAWGARLDGSTNDSLAIQAALSVVGEAFIPWTSTGFVADGITLGTGQTVRSDRKTTWKTTSGASYAVRITSFGIGAYATIEGFKFDLAASSTSATAIRFGTSSGVVFGFRGFNLDFKDCGEAIGDESHASNYIVDVYFKDCICFFTRGRQVYSRRSRGFFTFRDFKIDHTYNTATVTWEGARFENFIGLELEKFDVVGPVFTSPAPSYEARAIGLVLSGGGVSASAWLRRVLVDNTRGPGISINGVHNVFGVDTCVYQNLGTAIELNTVSKSQFVNTKVMGGKGLTSAPAGANGVTMSSCGNITFSALAVESCTGHGVVQVSCTECNLIGGYVKSNDGFGIIEVTAATRNFRSGLQVSGNASGSLVQLGAQCATVNWWPNSGTYTASTVGVTSVT